MFIIVISSDPIHPDKSLEIHSADIYDSEQEAKGELKFIPNGLHPKIINITAMSHNLKNWIY